MINKNALTLLSATMVLSFAPLFAKLIDLDAATITWWRVLLAMILLGLFLALRKQLRIEPGLLPWLALTGMLLGLHWWLFFLSIQTASVSIGVLTLFSYPLISALMEPVTMRTPLSHRQVLGGLGIVTGVYFLVPAFSLEHSITLGVGIGLLSALVYAIRNIITGNRLGGVATMTTLFYQLVFAFVTLSMVTGFISENNPIPDRENLLRLLILALIFTIAGHGLMTHCFKLFSAATVGIVASLQVVFSTVLAMILLAESPGIRFYFGAIIIVSIAIYELLPHKVETKNRN